MTAQDWKPDPGCSFVDAFYYIGANIILKGSEQTKFELQKSITSLQNVNLILTQKINKLKRTEISKHKNRSNKLKRTLTNHGTTLKYRLNTLNTQHRQYLHIFHERQHLANKQQTAF